MRKESHIPRTILLILCVVMCGFLAMHGVRAEQSSIRILYVSENVEDWRDDSFREALQLDSIFQVTHQAPDITNFTDYTNGSALLLEYDLVCILDQPLSPANQSVLREFVELGGGLLILCGNNLTENPNIFVTMGIIEFYDVGNISKNTELAISTPTRTADPLEHYIDWNSCPEAQHYTSFGATLISSFNASVMIEKKARDDSAVTSLDPLIFIKDRGLGRIGVISYWMEGQKNIQLLLWAYYNYFAYSFAWIVLNQGDRIVNFAQWHFSPVPHALSQILITSIVVLLVLLTILTVLKIRRQSNQTRDSLLEFNFEEKYQKKEKVRKRKYKPRRLKKEEITDWEEIGFHRQLSGFFTSFFITVLVGVPQLIIVFYAFPRFIMPYPMAEGQYRFTLKTFEAIWLVLDLGTKVSVVKYFSEYRVDNPKKAIHYLQIFTFWQFLTGVGQFAVVSVISLWIIPNTNLAHFSWFFLFHSMIQFPGFLLIIQIFFQGTQRLDLYQISDLLRNLIIILITQYGGILLFRMIFRNTHFGEAFGGVLGYMLGSWAAEILTFIFGIALFKKNFSKDLKISRIFFRIDFHWDELKQVMKYGIILVIGNVLVPLVWTIQTFLVSKYVSDYSSEIAYFELTMGLTSIFSLIGLFFSGCLPSLSEAAGNKKNKLRDYIFVQAQRWGNFLVFYLGGFLWAVGPLVILTFSGATWERAILFFPGLWLHGLLGPPSWLADTVFQHNDKTVKYNTWMWLLEQTVRLILLVILIPIMQRMEAVLWAYNPALLLKDLVSYLIIRRKMKINPKRYWWKSWISPMMAAGANYLVFIGIIALVDQGTMITTILLFTIGFFIFQPLYYVFLGLFGAFDDNSLKEFDKGTKMVTRGVRFLARSLYWAVYLGAVVLKSPLHKKYSIDLYDDAIQEAMELTMQKRVLEY
ncbi:MAG: oligosaccharide flippase family protein [Candidatus Lokiarchaeota archaeon]|nr:oligosaccharide flippase family protein [Candidatus Lokiarchaeota archaeon]